MRNELDKSLTVAGSKILLDTQVKRVLAQKQILSWIMKYTVREFMDLPLDVIEGCIEGDPEISTVKVNPGETNEKITGMPNEDKVPGEGAVYYDIRFFAVAPGDSQQIRVIINLEMQKSYYPGYPIVTRGIFYGARMISAQLGTEFSDSDYSNIRHVYSIWICTGVPDKIGNAISEYRLEKHDLIPGFPDVQEDYDKLSVVVIGLNEKKDSSSQLINMLNVLLSTEMDTTVKKQRLQDDFSMKMEHGIGKEEDLMCNYSDYVWEKGMVKGREEGLEEGMVKGREEGLEEGMVKGREEGLVKGREEGREEGETRLASLLMKMNAAGETEQVFIVLNDAKVREEFYKKYGL